MSEPFSAGQYWICSELVAEDGSVVIARGAGRAAAGRFKSTAGTENRFAEIGALAFCGIVSKTKLLQDMSIKGSFQLNHMDLGTQYIIVDDEFNYLATIDWEFAQAAPWQVNHLGSQTRPERILADPSHIAHKNVVRQDSARKLYRAGFRAAEADLRKKGRPIAESFAEIVDCKASRIYVCFSRLGRSPEEDQDLVQRMLRLAFEWDDADVQSYIRGLEASPSGPG
ncbi:hypothetical protein PWT90_09045 [Aphanocladium album]|nr:hypothetical protein PWT90_09045 [Aphanocladium album]